MCQHIDLSKPRTQGNAKRIIRPHESNFNLLRAAQQFLSLQYLDDVTVPSVDSINNTAT